MRWTDVQIREAGRAVAAQGFSLAANMLHAFAEQRRREIAHAESAGRKCVVCGSVILAGEDFVGVADGVIACVSGCDMAAARRLAAARVANPLLVVNAVDTSAVRGEQTTSVVNAWPRAEP